MTRIVFLYLIYSISAFSQSLFYTPKSNETEFIDHSYFTLGYNEKVEQSLWSYYILNKNQANGKYPRESSFYIDPLVSTGSANPSDYTHLKIDRGHLVPALDMSNISQAIYASFYTSNISPQYPSFNRGIWKKLENRVRDLAQIKNKLHVFSGPIFGSKYMVGKLKIPSHFYKIIYYEEKGEIKTFAFIIPNKGQSRDLALFLTAIDTIEKNCDIDFFSQLSSSIQNNFEGKTNLKEWKSLFR